MRWKRLKNCCPKAIIWRRVREWEKIFERIGVMSCRELKMATNSLTIFHCKVDLHLSLWIWAGSAAALINSLWQKWYHTTFQAQPRALHFHFLSLVKPALGMLTLGEVSHHVRSLTPWDHQAVRSLSNVMPWRIRWERRNKIHRGQSRRTSPSPANTAWIRDKPFLIFWPTKLWGRHNSYF